MRKFATILMAALVMLMTVDLTQASGRKSADTQVLSGAVVSITYDDLTPEAQTPGERVFRVRMCIEDGPKLECISLDLQATEGLQLAGDMERWALYGYAPWPNGRIYQYPPPY